MAAHLNAFDAARVYQLRWNGEKLDYIAAVTGVPRSTVGKFVSRQYLGPESLTRCGKDVRPNAFNALKSGRKKK